MGPFYFLFYVSASVCSGDVPIVACLRHEDMVGTVFLTKP
jgi:hypothetical protein